MHRWKDKDIKYDTVKFTFWIHFILVLIPQRLQVSGFVSSLEHLEIIWPHKLKFQRTFSNTQCFPSGHFFLFILDAYFFLLYCGALSTQQDLRRWPCSIMASLHPQTNCSVRGRWVKCPAGPASLLREQHRVVPPSQSPCTQVILMPYVTPV